MGGSSKRSPPSARLLANVDLMVCPPATLIMEFALSPARFARDDWRSGFSCARNPALTPAMVPVQRDAAAQTVIISISTGGTCTGKPMRRCARRRSAAKRAGLLPRLFASARRATSVPATLMPLCKRSSTVRCRTARPDRNRRLRTVWAIGTGLTPTTADVTEIHRFIPRAACHTLWRNGHTDAHLL